MPFFYRRNTELHNTTPHRFTAHWLVDIMADAPKLDFKMLVMPAIMLMSKKIDMKDPEIIYKLQIAFATGRFTAAEQSRCCAC
jgi:hypothetical protein